MLHKHMLYVGMAAVGQLSIVAVTFKLVVLYEFEAQLAVLVTGFVDFIGGSGTSGIVNRPSFLPGQTR